MGFFAHTPKFPPWGLDGGQTKKQEKQETRECDVWVRIHAWGLRGQAERAHLCRLLISSMHPSGPRVLCPFLETELWGGGGASILLQP